MLVVNLFASPSSGKSTLSAYIFSQLKLKGINCELVTEFVKDKVWEDNNEALKNQLYISGKQSYRLSRIADKVDIAIVDSPLLLGVFYNNNPILGEDFNHLMVNLFNSYDNMNFYINRVKKYNPIGRLQTEDESNKIATQILDMLDKYDIEYQKIDGNFEDAEKTLQQIINYCKSNNLIKNN